MLRGSPAGRGHLAAVRSQGADADALDPQRGRGLPVRLLVPGRRCPTPTRRCCWTRSAATAHCSRARTRSRSSGCSSDGSLEAWVWSIVVNAARQGRRRAAPREQESAVAPSPNGHASHVPLDVLSERQREIVFLRYYAELDTRRSPRRLGSAGTVGATLHRARANGCGRHCRRCTHECARHVYRPILKAEPEDWEARAARRRVRRVPRRRLVLRGGSRACRSRRRAGILGSCSRAGTGLRLPGGAVLRDRAAAAALDPRTGGMLIEAAPWRGHDGVCILFVDRAAGCWHRTPHGTVAAERRRRAVGVHLRPPRDRRRRAASEWPSRAAPLRPLPRARRRGLRLRPARSTGMCRRSWFTTRPRGRTLYPSALEIPAPTTMSASTASCTTPFDVTN